MGADPPVPERYAHYKRLLIEQRARVLYVTLNRPEVRNAADTRMQHELSTIFRDIAADEQAHVVVLGGAGGAFCAGGDVAAMREKLKSPQAWQRTVDEAREITFGLAELDRPVIAKVVGPAVGLGSTLALLCDIVVCAPDARIGDTHVRMGLTAGDGGALLWPLAVGRHRAMEYLLTGALLSAEEALAVGLCNRVVPADEIDEHVHELAERIAAQPTVAVRTTKRAVNLALRQAADAVQEAHFGLETLSHYSADRREAALAFLEKRPPRFTGH